MESCEGEQYREDGGWLSYPDIAGVDTNLRHNRIESCEVGKCPPRDCEDPSQSKEISMRYHLPVDCQPSQQQI